MMRTRHNNWLFVILIVVAAGAGFALALPWGGPMLHAVLGAYLVLVAPGLAAASAILPARRLGTAEHALVIPVVSIAVVVIGGLILDATPWGLQPVSWCALLIAVTAAASLAAFLRLRGRGGRYGSEEPAAVGQRRTLRLDRLALPLLAIVLLGFAVYVARLPAPAERYQGYTVLWMLPNSEQEATSAKIGLRSGEFAETNYRLELRVNGQLATVWPNLALEPNQQWQVDLALPAGLMVEQPGTIVEALLYRAAAPRIVYRQVRFQAGGHPG